MQSEVSDAHCATAVHGGHTRRGGATRVLRPGRTLPLRGHGSVRLTKVRLLATQPLSAIHVHPRQGLERSVGLRCYTLLSGASRHAREFVMCQAGEIGAGHMRERVWRCGSSSHGGQGSPTRAAQPEAGGRLPAEGC